MNQAVSGNDRISASDRLVFADAAGFADDQLTGDVIPGIQVHLEITVDAAAGNADEVDAC